MTLAQLWSKPVRDWREAAGEIPAVSFLNGAGKVLCLLATAPESPIQSNDAEPGLSRRKRLIFHAPHSSDGIVRGEDRNRGSKMDTRGARADGGEKYLR